MHPFGKTKTNTTDICENKWINQVFSALIPTGFTFLDNKIITIFISLLSSVCLNKYHPFLRVKYSLPKCFLTPTPLTQPLTPFRYKDQAHGLIYSYFPAEKCINSFLSSFVHLPQHTLKAHHIAAIVPEAKLSEVRLRSHLKNFTT